ncbi:hypothetical protein CDL12_15110 [Handroanthus impetiginosus]|uniref:Sexual differentiation process protein ISP4 n=1 Tax=Handroanthus impetiginosus TaxID=429701 RepID=A0A2G9H450_9LAMI|nr:hypothetical protein CDL12_15110 [Handroanthus impetiginosus]
MASTTSVAASAATPETQDGEPQPPASSPKFPVEEVALVVPETDDPTLPVMTFRAWFLGLSSCAVLSFLNTFFSYRTQPLNISAVVMQIAVLPIGKFMAATLPEKSFAAFGRWRVSLNPGPFNIKEHVIITIMANGGATNGGGDAHPMGIITVMKAYYKLSLNFIGAFLIVFTTQILGYGWAGMLRKYLVDPVEMWWPFNVAQFNTFDAQKFPIFSNQLFSSRGLKYDIEKILTPDYQLNATAYEEYGKLYLSPLFALSIGSGFAKITATLSHVVLFHGSAIWKQISQSAVKNIKLDIHARLMRSYKKVPQWWYLILLVGSIPLPILMSFLWEEQLQLPWWGVLFAFGLASLVTLPIGVIQATTNQQPGYDVVAQFIIGYLLPGKPIENLLFKIYGRTSVMHSLSFLADLKLGHYMKIPPRNMFTAQLAGTLVSSTVNLLLGWWILGTIENICDVKALHPESPWTCPKFRYVYDTSIIWGLIGPKRLFGPEGTYRNLIWLFLVGAILPIPVWILSKVFPGKKWIPLINIPVIFHGFVGMPPATPTNIGSGIITGIAFNYFVFKYRKTWWQKYNYVLSAALDAGTAFMGVFLFFALQNQGKVLSWWGSEQDHCPLASCPTASGIVVDGCPVFS